LLKEALVKQFQGHRKDSVAQLQK